MSTLILIIEAIAALKDRTGSSVLAINKWLETEKKVRGFQEKLWGVGGKSSQLKNRFDDRENMRCRQR